MHGHRYTNLQANGQGLVSKKKFGAMFGIVFFLVLFFPPATGLQTQNKMALVCRENAGLVLLSCNLEHALRTLAARGLALQAGSVLRQHAL